MTIWGVVTRASLVLAAIIAGWTGIAALRPMLIEAQIGAQTAGLVVAALTTVFAVALIALMSRRDRWTFSKLGLGSGPGDIRAFGVGVALWTGLAALGLWVGHSLGDFAIETAPLTMAAFALVGLQLLVVFLLEALPEELVLRGYLYTLFAERMPRWVSVIAQAVVFMIWAFALVAISEAIGGRSNWSIGLDRVVLFLTFGVTLALVRLWTGSLWASVGLHLAFQTATQLMLAGRLPVLRVADGGLEMAAIYLWFFGVVLSGLVALIGLWLSRGRRRSL